MLRRGIAFQIIFNFALKRATSSLFAMLNKIFNFYDIGLHDSPAID
jgi:hypothetical protein